MRAGSTSRGLPWEEAAQDPLDRRLQSRAQPGGILAVDQVQRATHEGHAGHLASGHRLLEVPDLEPRQTCGDPDVRAVRILAVQPAQVAKQRDWSGGAIVQQHLPPEKHRVELTEVHLTHQPVWYALAGRVREKPVDPAREATRRSVDAADTRRLRVPVASAGRPRSRTSLAAMAHDRVSAVSGNPASPAGGR